MSTRKAKFPAQFQYLDEIRDFVGNIASKGGFNAKEVYSIQLATDEAASNIIEHAYEDVPNGVIEITCGMSGDVLTIVLHDHGKSFDPSSVRPPNLKANLSERQIGGLGIYLMRKLMDEVHYESRPRGGNALTLTKRRG
ncbi:MAG: ATP-binding protein [Bacteroidota bacterium]